MECMVNSDNVVRGGLTPKLKDTATLIEILPYEARQAPQIWEGNLIAGSAADKYELKEFLMPAFKELRLLRLEIQPNCEDCVPLPQLPSLAIFVVMSGKGTIALRNDRLEERPECLAETYSTWYVLPGSELMAWVDPSEDPSQQQPFVVFIASPSSN